MLRRTGLTLTVALALALGACGSEDGGGDPVAGYGETAASDAPDILTEDPEITASITEIVSGNPDLSKLSELLATSGVGAELDGEGPFTLFAPDNVAFDKLGEAGLEALTAEDNRDELIQVLKAHVVPEAVMQSALRKMVADAGNAPALTTLAGTKISVTVELDQVKLANSTGEIATISIADIEGSNGVVHIVDTVLVPGN